jgi:hypothetical protein
MSEGRANGGGSVEDGVGIEMGAKWGGLWLNGKKCVFLQNNTDS